MAGWTTVRFNGVRFNASKVGRCPRNDSRTRRNHQTSQEPKCIWGETLDSDLLNLFKPYTLKIIRVRLGYELNAWNVDSSVADRKTEWLSLLGYI